ILRHYGRLTAIGRRLRIENRIRQLRRTTYGAACFAIDGQECSVTAPGKYGLAVDRIVDGEWLAHEIRVLRHQLSGSGVVYANTIAVRGGERRTVAGKYHRRRSNCRLELAYQTMRTSVVQLYW